MAQTATRIPQKAAIAVFLVLKFASTSALPKAQQAPKCATLAEQNSTLTPNGIDEDRYLWSCFLFLAQMSGRWDQLSERNYAPDRKRRAEAKIFLLPIARLPRATRGDKLWRLVCRLRPCAIDAYEKYRTNPKVASMCATWIGCVSKNRAAVCYLLRRSTTRRKIRP